MIRKRLGSTYTVTETTTDQLRFLDTNGSPSATIVVLVVVVVVVVVLLLLLHLLTSEVNIVLGRRIRRYFWFTDLSVAYYLFFKCC